MVAPAPGVACARLSPRKKRKPKAVTSPMEQAQKQLRDGQITEAGFRHRQEKIHLAECSMPWGEDIWGGHDRDYLRRLTGSGTAKRRCAGCRRKTPPQDLQHQLCTDCRTRAPRPRPEKRGSEEGLRASVYTRTSDDGTWVQVEDDLSEARAAALDEVGYDGSPTTDVLDAMSDAGASLRKDALPAEDDSTLAAGIAAYNASGELTDFLSAAGDARASEEQRRRYRAMSREMRPIQI